MSPSRLALAAAVALAGLSLATPAAAQAPHEVWIELSGVAIEELVADAAAAGIAAAGTVPAITLDGVVTDSTSQFALDGFSAELRPGPIALAPGNTVDLIDLVAGLQLRFIVNGVATVRQGTLTVPLAATLTAGGLTLTPQTNAFAVEVAGYGNDVVGFYADAAAAGGVTDSGVGDAFQTLVALGTALNQLQAQTVPLPLNQLPTLNPNTPVVLAVESVAGGRHRVSIVQTNTAPGALGTGPFPLSDSELDQPLLTVSAPLPQLEQQLIVQANAQVVPLVSGGALGAAGPLLAGAGVVFQHTAGSATFTAGSTVVTGTGATQWSTFLRPGFTIRADADGANQAVRVLTVVDDSTLVLERPYGGSSGTSVAYTATRTPVFTFADATGSGLDMSILAEPITVSQNIVEEIDVIWDLDCDVEVDLSSAVGVGVELGFDPAAEWLGAEATSSPVLNVDDIDVDCNYFFLDGLAEDMAGDIINPPLDQARTALRDAEFVLEQGMELGLNALPGALSGQGRHFQPELYTINTQGLRLRGSLGSIQGQTVRQNQVFTCAFASDTSIDASCTQVLSVGDLDIEPAAFLGGGPTPVTWASSADLWDLRVSGGAGEIQVEPGWGVSGSLGMLQDADDIDLVTWDLSAGVEGILPGDMFRADDQLVLVQAITQPTPSVNAVRVDVQVSDIDQPQDGFAWEGAPLTSWATIGGVGGYAGTVEQVMDTSYGLSVKTWMTSAVTDYDVHGQIEAIAGSFDADLVDTRWLWDGVELAASAATAGPLLSVDFNHTFSPAQPLQHTLAVETTWEFPNGDLFTTTSSDLVVLNGQKLEGSWERDLVLIEVMDDPIDWPPVAMASLIDGAIDPLILLQGSSATWILTGDPRDRAIAELDSIGIGEVRVPVRHIGRGMVRVDFDPRALERHEPRRAYDDRALLLDRSGRALDALPVLTVGSSLYDVRVGDRLEGYVDEERIYSSTTDEGAETFSTR